MTRPAAGTRPPGPRGWLPIRELLAFRGDLLQFLERASATYGDVLYLGFGVQSLCVVSHPDAIQEVLVTQHGRLPKSWVLRLATEALGEGMLTSNGPVHLHQRRLITPVLHKNRIPGYAETMVRLADRAAGGWRDGATVNMAAEMMRLTLSVVTQILFSTDFDQTAHEVGQAITDMAEVYERTTLPCADLIGRLRFLPGNRRFRQALGRLDAAIYAMIARRRASTERPDDALTLLLSARTEDGRPLTDRQVRDEAVAIFLAGQETTSDVLTWAWYLLSEQPEAEAAFHRELDEVLGGRLPGPGDLERLPFIRRVLTETMRLYPPGYALPRQATEPCVIGGYTVPAGTLVIANVYGVHRDARFYPSPTTFDPFRWTPQMRQQLPRYAYCPFGGGPHACLGDHFAWADATLLLAVLGQRWRARLVPGSPVTPRPLVNLRPRHGMPMTLTSRQPRCT